MLRRSKFSLSLRLEKLKGKLKLNEGFIVDLRSSLFVVINIFYYVIIFFDEFGLFIIILNL